MILLLTLGLLLGSAVPASAAKALLTWAYPRSQFPSASFTLDVTRSDANETTRRTLPLTLLGFCPARTGNPAGWATLCAEVCLERSDYALSVAARLEASVSPPSNVVEVIIGDPHPCPGGPVVEPPPRKPPEKTPPSQAMEALMAAAAATLVGVGANVALGASGPGTNFTLANPDCVDWKITGVCLCTPFPPTPCVKVSYWEPYLLVDTVKVPGTTALPFLQDFLHTALSAAGVAEFGGGGAGMTGGGHTNLHYNEAHVWAFPQLLGGPCTSCAPSPGLPFFLHYASELDPAWRTAKGLTPVSVIARIGTWAPLFPRVGFGIVGSEPVASGIAAIRAANIAFLPVGPEVAPPRPVLKKVDTLPTCCQMAHPRTTNCFLAGTVPALWDHATVSLRGSYVWILWKYQDCCVPPEQTTCGVTLPGIGRHGGQTCPPVPSP